MPLPADLAAVAGTDIYLLDLILRGRIASGMTALDVGCGDGRNLSGLLAAGCTVSAFDRDTAAVQRARMRFAGRIPGERIQVATIESAPFAGASFDVVVVNAVLHFADDQAVFQRWADACWRWLAPGGCLIARLSTRIGLPDARPPGFRYLATEEDLIACEARWAARRLDPLKTTLVERLRTMTTWTLERAS